jgi:hypothetical protein
MQSFDALEHVTSLSHATASECFLDFIGAKSENVYQADMVTPERSRAYSRSGRVRGEAIGTMCNDYEGTDF